MMDSSVIEDDADSSFENLKASGISPDIPSFMEHHYYDYSNSGSAVDAADFTTTREESKDLFLRNSEAEPITFQEVFESISGKNSCRSSLLSHVDIEPETKRLHLKADRTSIRARYGYDNEKKWYLFPEEALYLLEVGKIEIFCEHVSLSVQRARSLLLVPKRKDGDDKLVTCTNAEYFVFQQLTAMGYPVYRFRSLDGDVAMCEDSEDCNEDNPKMDEDNDDIIEVKSSRPNLKRKLAPSPSISSDENLLDDVDDDEFMDEDDEFDEPEHGPVIVETCSAAGNTSGYTVDEADSDVEIVDEVIYRHGGVEIQEISHSVGFQEEASDEPVASTSRGPDASTSQVLVDLVSSDDDEDELNEYGKRIWSKFIPNTKVMLKLPPTSLLPENIPFSDKIYELDLKDKSDVSDLELEFLVDEVSLNDDDEDKTSCDAKSWKEWRQNIFQEARDVMNESLLASTEHVNGDTAPEKLSLWRKPKAAENGVTLNYFYNKIVFIMYAVRPHGYSKNKALEEKPLYYVVITRQEESIPDLGTFGSAIDDVPILFACVCDNDHEAVFMTTDKSQLHSLF